MNKTSSGNDGIWIFEKRIEYEEWNRGRKRDRKRETREKDRESILYDI